MEGKGQSRARPLGYAQQRKRDATIVAVQEALAHLQDAGPAVDDLCYHRLTGDGVRERAAALATRHGAITQELQRALLLLLSMTESTPLDEEIIARR